MVSFVIKEVIRSNKPFNVYFLLASKFNLNKVKTLHTILHSKIKDAEASCCVIFTATQLP